MRAASHALRQALAWPCRRCCDPGLASQQRMAGSTPSREVLLDRLRRAKEDELRFGRPAKNIWEDRRTWVLIAGLVAGLGWTYSIVAGSTITDYVYMDISIANQPAGRLVLGLHGYTVPRASMNFLELATHQCGYGYKGSVIHQVMPRFAVIGGDITKGDGTGGISAFGPTIHKEKSSIHHRRGTLSMVCQDDAVRSQFFICCTPSRALDYNMVAFGKVVDGMELVDRISQMPTDDSGCPLQQVRIADCGKLSPVETDGSWFASLTSWFGGSRPTSSAGT